MIPGYAVRPFAPGDLPALQAIRAAAFAPVFASFRELVGPEIADIALVSAEADQARLLETICAQGSGHDLHVATCRGEPVGFVAFTADGDREVGEIGLNAVRPDHAGRGVGTAMYQAVLAEMKARGIAVVEVGTGGDPSHAPARRAYAKAGFGPSIPSVTLYRRI